MTMHAEERVLSIFDVLGPIMIGPSSNHTAGAVRVGRMGRAILGAEPTHAQLHFYGSLAETYRGHMTDRAVVAGLLGFEVDDPRIREALLVAEQKGLQLEIHTQTQSDKNPNTIEMYLRGNGPSVQVTGISIGGGEIVITEIDDFQTALRGNEEVVLVTHTRKEPVVDLIAGILGRNLVSSEVSHGRAGVLLSLFLDRPAAQPALDAIAAMNDVRAVTPINSLYSYRLRDTNPLFRTIADMVAMTKDENKSLAQIVVDYEARRSGLDEAEIRGMIRSVWTAMKESMEQGLTKENHPLGQIISGKDSKKLLKACESGKTISGRVIPLALARAIACGEVNASMGKVVAAPTAGAVGVIPAVLSTIAEETGAEETAIEDALLVAAGIGLVIASRVPVSGAMGGCQSEVGVASGMAAAALVQMAGGTAHQASQAMALALKNILGLVCDTVAGPAEVPCIKRNVVGVVNAMATAEMALAGIESVIPPDEVISALQNVQSLMPMELRDTTLGGLGNTETGRRLKAEWLCRIGA
jgi:L-serine dehydratase